MANKYFYKNQDINSLTTTTGGTISVPEYTSFPKQLIGGGVNPQYTSRVTNPFPLSYLYQNTDVANYCTAYTTTLTATTSTLIPIPLNGITYKHISTYGWGGGGGGGGGGGAYSNPTYAQPGGAGAPGASGAYAGTVQVPITGAITYQIGTGGTGGTAGSKNANGSGGAGNGGAAGNATNIKIGNNAILTAPGGGGGGGGNGGNYTNEKSGTPGSTGSTPASSVNAGSPTTVNAPTSNTVWPQQTSGGGGSGGNNGNAPTPATSGSKGANGYLQIYFLYQ